MQITKQQVNEFTPGQQTPCCQLQVKLEKDKKPVELEHKVKLLGAKKDFNFFTITCTPEGMSHCLFAKVIGTSLSEPHTSVTALRTCVCMYV